MEGKNKAKVKACVHSLGGRGCVDTSSASEHLLLGTTELFCFEAWWRVDTAAVSLGCSENVRACSVRTFETYVSGEMGTEFVSPLASGVGVVGHIVRLASGLQRRTGPGGQIAASQWSK